MGTLGNIGTPNLKISGFQCKYGDLHGNVKGKYGIFGTSKHHAMRGSSKDFCCGHGNYTIVFSVVRYKSLNVNYTVLCM